MQGNRIAYTRNKPRIILDISFIITKNLNVGDKGQFILNGSIIAEHIREEEDGTDLLIKTIEINSVELIDDKTARSNGA